MGKARAVAMVPGSHESRAAPAIRLRSHSRPAARRVKGWVPRVRIPADESERLAEAQRANPYQGATDLSRVTPKTSPPQRRSYEPGRAGTSSCWPTTSCDGFGGIGEGMSIQIAPDGRRILWLAHESAPKNFTAVDVTDPRKPKIVVQTDLPQRHMRSNSLEMVGDIMAVAYQTQGARAEARGFELFDISTPEKPKIDRASSTAPGPNSRGVHQLWFADGENVHMRSRRAGFHADAPQRRPVLPHHRRAQPVQAGRGQPLVAAGHARGDNEPPPKRHPKALDTRLPRAQHQRLSASGPTAFTSAISTAG